MEAINFETHRNGGYIRAAALVEGRRTYNLLARISTEGNRIDLKINSYTERFTDSHFNSYPIFVKIGDVDDKAAEMLAIAAQKFSEALEVAEKLTDKEFNVVIGEFGQTNAFIMLSKPLEHIYTRLYPHYLLPAKDSKILEIKENTWKVLTAQLIAYLQLNERAAAVELMNKITEIFAE